jgi:rod shape determining protein RodA
MKKKLTFKNFSIYFDQYLFISITLLSVMGLFFLYSASQGDINTVIKQSIFVGFGLFLMFVLSQPDPDFYKIFSSLFIVLACSVDVCYYDFWKRGKWSKKMA